MNRPHVIQEVGFDFDWDSKKVWALDVPVEKIDVKELVWHFHYPFWDSEGTDEYNLIPQNVIDFPAKEPTHWKLIQNADTSYPIDIMMNKGRWTILDGLHRLVKLYLGGNILIKVRKVPVEMIDKITR